MEVPFLNKNFSSSSSSNSNSSWAWPSCHQNPRTVSFRATITANNPYDVDEKEEEEEEEKEEPLFSIILSSSSSSTQSTVDGIEELPETESIENVIKGIKPSERLIFDQKGKSKSILEEMTNKDTNPWNQSTFSTITNDSWWRWLRYTPFITAREASKCIMKTTK
ncbi:unnamed protein product [Eruca vesicaria subsp. sativa]|uniref:Ovate family protein n=1 Tax=Eruca vesicaria subsp. sativa TaxID=29727 RepID=A0ABC8L8C1_ERUVS|nr:unnamed protein product [Eruca vesicaria subsp. sativa]